MLLVTTIILKFINNLHNSLLKKTCPCSPFSTVIVSYAALLHSSLVVLVLKPTNPCSHFSTRTCLGRKLTIVLVYLFLTDNPRLYPDRKHLFTCWWGRSRSEHFRHRNCQRWHRGVRSSYSLQTCRCLLGRQRNRQLATGRRGIQLILQIVGCPSTRDSECKVKSPGNRRVRLMSVW